MKNVEVHGETLDTMDKRAHQQESRWGDEESHLNWVDLKSGKEWLKSGSSNAGEAISGQKNGLQLLGGGREIIVLESVEEPGKEMTLNGFTGKMGTDDITVSNMRTELNTKNKLKMQKPHCSTQTKLYSKSFWSSHKQGSVKYNVWCVMVMRRQKNIFFHRKDSELPNLLPLTPTHLYKL